MSLTKPYSLQNKVLASKPAFVISTNHPVKNNVFIIVVADVQSGYSVGGFTREHVQAKTEITAV